MCRPRGNLIEVGGDGEEWQRPSFRAVERGARRPAASPRRQRFTGGRLTFIKPDH